MADAAEAGPAAGGAPQPIPSAQLIEALRARRADRFDPVGFRYLEALARRGAGHRAEARRVVDRKLAEAVADYTARFELAGRDASETLARATARFPDAADALSAHRDAGDFGALNRLLEKLEAQRSHHPLAELLADLQRQTADGIILAAPADGTSDEPQGELKSLRYFRGTWAKLSLDRQLSTAFAQAPENAGPLNSHFLVLQSLKLMREISPEYLEQFVSYVDALLWLDQADAGRGPAQKNPARGEREAAPRRKPRTKRFP